MPQWNESDSHPDDFDGLSPVVDGPLELADLLPSVFAGADLVGGAP
jgi:hypothetical protein